MTFTLEQIDGLVPATELGWIIIAQEHGKDFWGDPNGDNGYHIGVPRGTIPRISRNLLTRRDQTLTDEHLKILERKIPDEIFAEFFDD